MMPYLRSRTSTSFKPERTCIDAQLICFFKVTAGWLEKGVDLRQFLHDSRLHPGPLCAFHHGLRPAPELSHERRLPRQPGICEGRGWRQGRIASEDELWASN